MAEKGNHGLAGADEERQHDATNPSSHGSHERGAAHEFNNDDAAEQHRKGPEQEEAANGDRPKRTRGGTHDQHVKAGTKGGSRIRQLIEMGYKYEQEHGIGPGQNERSKLAAKKRSRPSDTADTGEG